MEYNCALSKAGHSRQITFILLAILCTLIFNSLSNAANESAGQDTLAEALRSYQQGHTTDAIDSLKSLIKTIDPEKNPLQYSTTYLILMEILFNAHDVEEFIKTYSELVKTKISNLEQKDQFFFMAIAEMERIRGLYLLRNHDLVIEQGKKRLQQLGSFTPGLFNEVRVNIALTVGASLFAKSELAEAESFFWHALIVGSTDPEYYGYKAIKLLNVILKFHVQMVDTVHLQVLLQIIAKHPEIWSVYFPNTIDSLEFETDVAEAILLLNNYPIAKRFLDLAINRESTVDKLPLNLRLRMYEMRLFIAVMENDKEKTGEWTGRIQQLLKGYNSEKLDKYFTPILAWSSFITGDREKAKSLIDRYEKVEGDINVYTTPLISAVKGTMQFIDQRHDEGLSNVTNAFDQILKIYSLRSISLSAGSQALSVVEKIIVLTFLEMTARPETVRFLDQKIKNMISLAMQMLQRERVIIGARIAESRLITSDEANVAEHIRELDFLYDSRRREYSAAIERLVAKMNKSSAEKKSDDNSFSGRNRVLEIQFRIDEINQYLRNRMGEEFYLSRAGIAPLNKVQSQLVDDEIMISHTGVAPNKYAVECITNNTSSLQIIDVNDEQFASNARLVNMAVTRAGPPSDILDTQFPADASLFLYNSLFSIISKYTEGKKTLLIASDPNLALLPYNALLTAMPNTRGEGFDLKNAPWLIKKHSIALIVSRAMFIRQRSIKAVKTPDLSFIAFANPRLNGISGEIQTISPEKLYAKRGLANVSAIRELPDLPDTQEEIDLLSKIFGKEHGRIFIGRDATERALRSQDLSRYKMLVFATHGLTAGEFDGIAEPALVLTPESDEDSRSDGLITMSEISKLSLNADLVMLSACNTAAADGSPSGRGFSGLASAFFGAGARSIMASQWPVASFAATRLTTGIFLNESNESNMTVSEGLQRSMLSFLQKTESPAFAHPRFWAPFVIAGDGSVTLGALLRSQNRDAGIAYPLATNWDINYGDTYVGEIMSIATDSADRLYLYKYGDPDSKKGRAKSVFAKTDKRGQIIWRVEDKEVSVGDSILVAKKGPIITGYVNSKKLGLGTVLRAFDHDGNERWRKIVDSPLWDHSLGIAGLSSEHILWVVMQRENSHRSKEKPTKISIMKIDESGKTITLKNSVVLLPDASPIATNVVLTNEGLLVAVNYAFLPSSSVKFQYDEISGYVQTCASNNLSILLLINNQSGKVLKRSDLQGIWLNNMKIRKDGRIFAAANIARPCTAEGDAAIIEITRHLETAIVFKYGGPISKHAGDIAFLSSGEFVIVGRFEILFAPDVYRGFENLRKDWAEFSGEFFARENKTWDAFIAVVSEKGELIKDRVIGDLRGRWLTSVIRPDNKSIIAGGTANGTSGWLISLVWPDDQIDVGVAPSGGSNIDQRR